jgi:hypothetical protein
MKKSKETATQEEVEDFVKNTKYILALKSGTLIPVLPTTNPNKWQDCYEKTIYTLTPQQTHRKIFSGDTAIDDAIAWIDY